MKRGREEFQHSYKKVKIHPLILVIYDILDSANQTIILKDISSDLSILKESIERLIKSSKRNTSVISENLINKLNDLFNLRMDQDVVLTHADKVILKSLSYRLDSALIPYINFISKVEKCCNTELTFKQDIALLGKSKDDNWLKRLNDKKEEKLIAEQFDSMSI
jgi:hypothetical protein